MPPPSSPRTPTFTTTPSCSSWASISSFRFPAFPFCRHCPENVEQFGDATFYGVTCRIIARCWLV
jgi:hypothetical protein